MPKFFVSPDKVSGDKIIVDTEDVKHILRVLRMGVGDKITLCDTSGFDYEAEISNVGDVSLECTITSKQKSVSEPNVSVTLYQALPKASKMEYIIQKTTELGIAKIVPVKMSRCVVKIESDKDAKKKVERWSKIAESAAKQSGRGIIPEISMPITFDDALVQMKKSDVCFAPYECETEKTLHSVIDNKNNIKSVSFIIGPEGGFDLNEVSKLCDSGINTITLGKRILRTETAGEAVLAMVMYGLGEI